MRTVSYLDVITTTTASGWTQDVATNFTVTVPRGNGSAWTLLGVQAQLGKDANNWSIGISSQSLSSVGTTTDFAITDQGGVALAFVITNSTHTSQVGALAFMDNEQGQTSAMFNPGETLIVGITPLSTAANIDVTTVRIILAQDH